MKQRLDPISLQIKILLLGILVTLLTIGLIAHTAFAQGFEMVKITNANASPTSVTTGQSMTVTITVSFQYNSAMGEGLVIGLVDHTENGNVFPVTYNSCDPKRTQSICFANPSSSQLPGYGGSMNMGDFTASFTLNAPSTGTYMVAIAEIVQMNSQTQGFTTVTSDYKILPVTIAVPEMVSPFLFLCLTFIPTVYLIRKRRGN